ALYAFAKDGKALFRLMPPVAVDVNDARRTGFWKLEADAKGSAWSIRAVLDTRGLVFPLLVDPAFDTPEWFPDLTADSAITPRAGATLVFDSNDRCLALFGGATSGFVLQNDLYARCAAITSNQWAQISASIAPPKRAYAAMAWDPLFVSGGTSGAGFLFGGYLNGSGSAAAADDVWIGSNQAAIWTQIPKPAVGAWQSKRFLHGMAWTGNTHKHILQLGRLDVAGNRRG